MIFHPHIIDLFNLRASDKARVSISFFLIISFLAHHIALFHFAYFINLAISIVKFDIIHITDIQNVTPNMIPIFLGIGSTLLNVRIMNINVLKFIRFTILIVVYDNYIFLYS